MATIRSFSVGDGDTFAIRHNTSNYTVIDCNLVDDEAERIVGILLAESKDKDIKRFISTHPDDDHIHGLRYLNERMPILNFYCVKNKATKEGATGDFEEYCRLRDDKEKAFYLRAGCSRCWMNKDDDEKQYGSAGIDILWPNTSNETFHRALKDAEDGKSPNNISPIIKYRLSGGITALWMGDLETAFMEEIEDEVDLPSIDVLFAPHHGRSSGRPPKSWMESMSPKLVVVGEAPSEELDYYNGWRTITQNSTGDIMLYCYSNKADVYVSKANYEADFLRQDELVPRERDGLSYIGTLDCD